MAQLRRNKKWSFINCGILALPQLGVHYIVYNFITTESLRGCRRYGSHTTERWACVQGRLRCGRIQGVVVFGHEKLKLL